MLKWDFLSRVITTMADNPTFRHQRKTASSAERRLSLALLGGLAVIAAVMLCVQSRFDSGAWREQAQTAEPEPVRQPETTPTDSPDNPSGLTPLSPAEHYTGETLSDKIDGKADLYLGAGFQGLESRRFALTVDKGRWMERYVYDMGSLRNAYAVFSAQQRPHAQPLDVTAHAYLAGNGLFFVHGPFYVEIIAAEASAEVREKMSSAARAFAATHAVPTEDLSELRLLPENHRSADAVKLAIRSAFGIEGLDGVFTAVYAAGQAKAIAFISKRASRNEAEALAEKFHAFWLDYGGEETAAPLKNPPGARVVLILDNYEISLVEGDYLIGVHEATHLEFGMELAAQLQRHILEGAK